MPLQCPLLAAAERGRGEKESDSGGHGAGIAEAEGHAGQVLGESGGDRSASAEPNADEELAGQDPVRGVAWKDVGDHSSAHVQLPYIRQGAEPSEEALRSQPAWCLHRVR